MSSIHNYDITMQERESCGGGGGGGEREGGRKRGGEKERGEKERGREAGRGRERGGGEREGGWEREREGGRLGEREREREGEREGGGGGGMCNCTSYRHRGWAAVLHDWRCPIHHRFLPSLPHWLLARWLLSVPRFLHLCIELLHVLLLGKKAWRK